MQLPANLRAVSIVQRGSLACAQFFDIASKSSDITREPLDETVPDTQDIELAFKRLCWFWDGVDVFCGCL